MRRHFHRLLALSTGLWVASGTAAFSKPPGLPATPETEFKVLSTQAQEFNQSDDATSTSLFLPNPSLTPPSAAAAAVVGGWAIAMANNAPSTWSLKPDLSPWEDWSSILRQQMNTVVEESTRRVARSRLAREVFEMAETHQRAGDVEEARHWYLGVTKLYPESEYNSLAVARLERLAMARLIAEAGEEQSEEPPIAGPERIIVMPRELKR